MEDCHVLTKCVQIDDPVAHSLHLVLPPPNVSLPSAPASTTASSATSTIAPSRSFNVPPGAASQEQLPPAQDRPESGQQPPPTVASGVLQVHQLPTDNGHNNFAHAQGHVPPHIQAAMNSHFAALSQQLGQQLAMGTVNSLAMPTRPIQSNHLHQLSTSAQPSFQQVITQQQQARAAAGWQGVADVPIIDPTNRQTVPQAQTPTSDQATSTLPHNTSENGNFPTTETREPNVNHWRITVNESTITIPTAHVGYSAATGANTLPSAPVGPQAGFSIPANALTFPMAGHQGAATQPNPIASHSPAPALETSGRIREQHNESVQQGIFNLERMLAGGSVPSQHQINTVRSQISDLGRHRNESLLHTRLSNISTRASQIGRNSTGEAAASESMIPFAASIPNSVNPMVYLLSSPSGPHALLVSPSGLYGTVPRIIPASHESAPFATNMQQQQHRNQDHVINRVEDFRGRQPAVHRAPNHAQPAPQDQAQARDLARILLPLGGHLWLFVRLFGFVYFFTPGGGWRRAAVLFCSALLVLFLQSGVFRPIYQAAWEPVRRHLEGLVPLADNGRHDGGGAQGAVAPIGGHIAQAAAGRDPDVMQAAVRLVRERDRRDLGAVRQYLRSFERAVAIFFASLVPGIGERHIAARDTAEAVRLVEEMEREVVGLEREEVAEEPGVEEPIQRGTTTLAASDDRNEEDSRVTHDQPPVVEV